MNALSAIEQLLRNPTVQIDVSDFVLALVFSVVSAIIVSMLYQIFYENRATGSQIHRSFLLISPSITALFIAIQFSLPLSLGLVGALTLQKYLPRLFRSKRNDGILLITLTGDTLPEVKDEIIKWLEANLTNGKLQTVSYSDNLTTIHYSFSGLRGKNIDGLQSSLKQITPIQKMNVFFNRRGALL